MEKKKKFVKNFLTGKPTMMTAEDVQRFCDEVDREIKKAIERANYARR